MSFVCSTCALNLLQIRISPVPTVFSCYFEGDKTGRV